MQSYNGVRVLVTGGAGFIGSHIVDALVEHGARVIVLDNFSTGSRENLKQVANHITIMRGDVTDRTTCIIAATDCSIIFHCAALTSVPESIENPQACFSTNIIGTHTMLEAARIVKARRIIFSSSAAVYGNQEGICREDDPCFPTSPYGFSKQCGELLCKQYAQIYGIDTVCLRYFNVFGSRQNGDAAHAGVVAKLRLQFARNKPIVLFGDGTQTRDFVSVKTIAEANIAAGIMRLENHHTVINVASGRSMSLRELVAQLHAEYPTWNQDISFLPQRPGDIKHSAADCKKLIALQEAHRHHQHLVPPQSTAHQIAP